MKALFLIISFGSLLLGVLGYLEKIFGWQYSVALRWFLVSFFVLFWIGNRALEVIKEKRAPELFYGKEIVEIFPHSFDVGSRMKFLTDRQGNKCVVLSLGKSPVPKSVKLFEGGYEAPPITLGFNGKEILFKNSAYASLEEYLKNGPVYQIRYFPKE